MQNSAELVGRLVAAFLLGLPALFFLIRAFRKVPRSRRLADLALFCGLMTLFIPELALELSPVEHSAAFLAVGLIRVTFGVTGLVLAVAALVNRGDGGAGIARVIAGAVLSLVHVTSGSGLLLFSSFARPATPWVYRSADGSYSLQLPSKQWKQAPETAQTKLVAFVHALPRMQARIVAASPNQTEDGFMLRSNAFRDRVKTNAQQLSKTNFREETNAAGNVYHYTTTLENTPGGERVFVAHSIVWCAREEKVIEVIFEGLSRMRSKAGQAAEMAAFERAAESICLSAE